MRLSRGFECGPCDVNVNGRKGSAVAESKIVFVKLHFYWSPCSGGAGYECEGQWVLGPAGCVWGMLR